MAITVTAAVVGAYRSEQGGDSSPGWSWNTPQPRLRIGPSDPNQRRMTTNKSLLTQRLLSMFTAGGACNVKRMALGGAVRQGWRPLWGYSLLPCRGLIQEHSGTSSAVRIRITSEEHTQSDKLGCYQWEQPHCKQIHISLDNSKQPTTEFGPLHKSASVEIKADGGIRWKLLGN